MKKISVLCVEPPQIFYVIEKNDLNDNYMVCSPYDELPKCWAFKDKRSATNFCDKINLECKKEYEIFIQKNKS